MKKEEEDFLPQAHWGTADAPLFEDWRSVPDEDIDDDDEAETPDDVIEMLGFDPDDMLLGEDAQWEESKHKRGQPENAGQFGPGGGGKLLGTKAAKGAKPLLTEKAGTAEFKEKSKKLRKELLDHGHEVLKDKLADSKEALANKQAEKGGAASQLFRQYGRPTKTAAEIAEAAGATEKIVEAKEKLAKSVPTDAPVKDGGFIQEDGSYTPERLAVQNKILKELFSPEAVKKAMPEKGMRPTMTVLGGRGGSGKSWLTSNRGPIDASKSVLIDADSFKSKLPGYEGWNAAMYHEESSYMVAKAQELAQRHGCNVIHDATIRSTGAIFARITDYKSRGYDVHGYYMFASPEVACERSMQRFVRGGTKGRFVPPEVILESDTNEKNFDEATQHFTKWGVYDNNTGGSSPKVVKESGGEDESVQRQDGK